MIHWKKSLIVLIGIWIEFIIIQTEINRIQDNELERVRE